MNHEYNTRSVRAVIREGDNHLLKRSLSECRAFWITFAFLLASALLTCSLLVFGGILGAASDYTVEVTFSHFLRAISNVNNKGAMDCFPLPETYTSIVILLVIPVIAFLPLKHVRTLFFVVLAGTCYLVSGWLGFGLFISDFHSAVHIDAEWLGEAWPFWEFNFILSLTCLVFAVLSCRMGSTSRLKMGRSFRKG